MKIRKPSAKQIRETMRYLSSLGAAKGGNARAASLSDDRLSEIARQAAKARWAKWTKNRES